MKLSDSVELAVTASGGWLLSTLTAPAWGGGPAFSGPVAEADTAESVFAAPAGISRLEGTRITLQGMVATSRSRFDVDEGKTNVDGGDPDKGDGPTVIPSFYLVHQLDDRWHVGASLSIPTGFGSSYGSTWAVITGVGFPVNERMTYKVWAAYLSQAVDDDDRTLAMRLDEAWCVGAGPTCELMEGRSVDFNANLLLLGKGRVDQTSGLLGQRRVAGESTDPYAVTVEMACHF